MHISAYWVCSAFVHVFVHVPWLREQPTTRWWGEQDRGRNKMNVMRLIWQLGKPHRTSAVWIQLVPIKDGTEWSSISLNMEVLNLLLITVANQHECTGMEEHCSQKSLIKHSGGGDRLIGRITPHSHQPPTIWCFTVVRILITWTWIKGREWWIGLEGWWS